MQYFLPEVSVLACSVSVPLSLRRFGHTLRHTSSMYITYSAHLLVKSLGFLHRYFALIFIGVQTTPSSGKLELLS